jgi:hypothetical protein
MFANLRTIFMEKLNSNIFKCLVPPPRKHLVFSDLVIKVKGFLLAQAHYREDGPVPVVPQLCVLHFLLLTASSCL